MRRQRLGLLVLWSSFGLFLTALAVGGEDPARPAAPPRDKKVDFRTEVAPILQQTCVDCHGPELQMAGLRLDQRKFAIEDGQELGLIIPGKSAESLLIRRLTDKEAGLIMPPSFPFFPGEKAGLPEKQIEILKNWIDQGANWPEGVSLTSAASESKLSPEAARLFAAIRAGDHKAAARLLEKPALAAARDRHGSTPLIQAALYSDAEMVRLLIERKADVNAANKDGVTALMLGAGDLEKVRLLVKQGAKVDARSELGRTPLLIAATYAGNSKTVQLLLGAGAKATEQDNFHETPLTSAAKRGDVEMVEILIKAGADVNAGGRPPLVWAAEEGNAETIAALLAHGAGEQAGIVNAALFSAAVRGPAEAVRLLLDKGGDPNAPAGFAGYTPLMGAAYSDLQSAEIVNMLLEQGGDVTAKGANGETVLTLARKHGDTRIVRILERRLAAK